MATNALSQHLVQLGFSKNEARVYEALVELGQCKASAIIKDTNLHRNIVYEALDELVQRKLAFKTSKGGVAFFQLSDADTLVQEAESTLNTAEKVAQEINTRRQKASHEVKMYEGKNGLKAAREKAYAEIDPSADNSENELLVIGANIQPELDQEYMAFWQSLDRKREELGIPARMLFSPEVEPTGASTFDNEPLTQTRLLPEETQDAMAVDIWKDTIALRLFDTDPFIVSITNKKVANAFREHFEQLWNTETQVFTGLNNAQKFFDQKMYGMESGEEYQVMWATYGDDTRDEMVPYFETYHKERVKRGVGVKLLGYEKDRSVLRDEITIGADPAMEISEVRFLVEDTGAPMQLNIYPDSVTFFYWHDDAIVVDIKRQEIRDAMKLYFDALWNGANT